MRRLAGLTAVLWLSATGHLVPGAVLTQEYVKFHAGSSNVAVQGQYVSAGDETNKIGEWVWWYANQVTQAVRFYAGRKTKHVVKDVWSGISITQEHDCEHGVSTEWYPNGIIKQRESYAWGDRDGVCEYFDPQGRRRAVRYYTPGHVTLESNWVDGILWVVQHWSNGVAHGVHEEFHRNGCIARCEYYNDGKLTGSVTQWYENAVICEIRHYSNGMIHGASVRCHIDGQIWRHAYHEAGRRAGLWVTFFTNSIPCNKGCYSNDVRHGVWHFYNEDGALKEEREYDMGKRIR